MSNNQIKLLEAIHDKLSSVMTFIDMVPTHNDVEMEDCRQTARKFANDALAEIDTALDSFKDN